MDQLRREGRTISIIITTDGLPSTEANENELHIPEFIQALQAFQNLPVSIVIRLCTDDEKVFDFYNSLDKKINNNIDVLDDLVGEGLEVYLQNPWLNYALSLHRVRVLGCAYPILDALDEHALSPSEVRDLCSLLFVEALPDPMLDWVAFVTALSLVVAREPPQWNPVSKTMCPWIDLYRLHAIYGGGNPVPANITINPSFAQPKHSAHDHYSSPSASQPSAYPTGTPPFVHHLSQHPSPRNPFDSGDEPQTNSTQAQPNVQPHVFGQQTQAPPNVQPHLFGQQTPGPPAHSSTTSCEDDMKKNILTAWALQPPALQSLRPIEQLLASVKDTFPPAFGVSPHAYFGKYNPMSIDALYSRDKAVLSRGK